MNLQQRLGQFFTPPKVAQAIVELVQPYLPPDPTVADLSCGEGILLSMVLQQGLTKPERVWGLDIDPKMLAVWKGIDSLKGCHLRIQDGLTFELSQIGTHHPGIDLGIGNPPYNRSQNLIVEPKILDKFQLGRKRLTPSKETVLNVNQLGFDFENPLAPVYVRIFDRLETVVSQPIEVLFLEKFIQVAKSGGLIALILPEGLFSNEGSQDVRDFLVDQVDILAIIGLPRRIFNNDAKTDILLLRKKPKPKYPQNPPDFLASVSETLRRGDNSELIEAIRVYHQGYHKPVDHKTTWTELADAKRVFYVVHSDEAWQAFPPKSWGVNNYRQWIGGEIAPQPEDPLLIYKFPADSPNAGFCSIHRIVSCNSSEIAKDGYSILSEPWIDIEPPLTYAQMGEGNDINQWSAYRVRFRGWAKGGYVPENIFKAFVSMIRNRVRISE
jgi:SAM-dependent methyltransferase